MKKTIFNIYRAVRSVFVSALLVFVCLYSALYIILSVPAIQNHMRTVGEEELSGLLGTSVTIGKIEFSPFNELSVFDIRVPDLKGDTLLTIDKTGVGISIYDLIFHRKITFNYAEILGLYAHITQDRPSGTTNLQFVIDAFKPKKQGPPTRFNVSLDAIVIRKSELIFDILSEPRKKDSSFDKNHIHITQLSGDIRIPTLRNDRIEVELKRFSLAESSGFDLSKLSMTFFSDSARTSVKDIKIELPNSTIIPEDISIPCGFPELNKQLSTAPFQIRLANSHVSLSDLQAFVPAFKNFQSPFYITCAAEGNAKDIRIQTLDLTSEDPKITLQTSGRIHKPTSQDPVRIEIPNVKLTANISSILHNLPPSIQISNKAKQLINNARYLTINGSVKSDLTETYYSGNVSTALGLIVTTGTYTHTKGSATSSYTGHVWSKRLDIGEILNQDGILGETAFDTNLSLTFSKKRARGKISGDIPYADIKGYRYRNIKADLLISENSFDGILSLKDKNADITISGTAKIAEENSAIDIKADLEGINFHNLNLTPNYPGNALSANIDATFTGNDPDNAEGDILISGIRYVDPDGKGIKIDHFDITSRKKGEQKYMTVNSDILNGYIDGYVNFKHIVPTVKNIFSTAFPGIFQPQDSSLSVFPQNTPAKHNDFSYSFKIAENDEITSFFKLPVRIVHPISISGSVNDCNRKLSLGIDAPYFMQGNKVFEKTSLSVNVDGNSDIFAVNAVSQLDNKNGNILFIFSGNAANNRLDTDVSWRYDRKHDFSGTVSLSTTLRKPDFSDSIQASIQINPTTFAVNDTIWQIESSRIDIAGKRFRIAGLNVNRENQFIKADGYVSASHDDRLQLQLKSIDLGYVFETLNINHVAFSGIATGDFYATGALSPTPQLNTSNLNVKQFAYHNAILGEADIKSRWDYENKGIVINADIHQYNGRESLVHGIVYPTRDSLAFKFNADRLNVQILKPFMAAFSSDISGEASGEAELYGTFKLINMKGRLFADQFKMKVDFTNTTYSVSDSIFLDPGHITIRNATVKDPYGHTAKLNGSIRHRYFKNVEFDFAVTDAKDILCFNTTPKQNPNWYGTVYANGTTFIKGGPGIVNLDINMTASPNSSFAFVLSDREEAGEYSFITFTDKEKEIRTQKQEKDIPEFLRKIRQQQKQNSSPSVFNLNLQTDVNPNIALTLVMDPNGGDKIRATGNGNIRIGYSSNDAMKIFGNYTVEEGRYNFTLQDIIIRDFTIKQGGVISFHGDPMSANVDLSAAYSLNANLLDLDESFANDKDLNRTLVPVNALLNLSGVISQPEISFDLEFPTLTQDIYRKVKSIISTDDMMNQQIIYLLALSRFYTPEYMGGSERNNELASVASSTISSQLTSMLGQLSDKWSIAPNFHTDKGDFSDVEVELALSSRLLNNRLLLNGNFGYSDNSMNNNNFIGDFDIEYLLTKSGNIRLKAYNRYNDQNYYIRNSLTTQGVGIVFKHDFDRIFKKRKKAIPHPKEPADTTGLPPTPVPEKRKSVRK